MYELSSQFHKCQAPAGLEKNKGHIYIANGSPPTVIQAYTNQFQRDFSLFLGLRSEEIKPAGRMVITIIGRSMEDPSGGECCDLWELLAESLTDMLAEVSLLSSAKYTKIYCIVSRGFDGLFNFYVGAD